MRKNPVKKQTAERRISAFLRLGLALLLFLLNTAAVVLLAYFLRAHAVIVFALLEIAAIIAAVNIQSKPRSASYKLAWTLLVVAVPVSGLILYVLWGGNHQRKNLNLIPLPPPSSRNIEQRQSEGAQERLGASLPNWQRASRLLTRQGFLLYRGTNSVYFPSGKAFFDDAIAKMEQAERFIFLEYFILAEGRLWDRIYAILCEKARAGVEIKIIFDDFGNITRM